MSVLSRFESRLKQLSPQLWRVYHRFEENEVPFMAGSVAFSAFLSLLPLLVLVYVAVAIVAEGSLADQVIRYTGSFLPPQGQELIAQSIEERTEPSGESVISVVVLLWGALRLFLSLDTAFAEIYATEDDESFLERVEESLVVLSVLIVALVAMVGAGIAFAFVDAVPYIGFVTPLVLVVALTVVFLPIYYAFPDAETTLRGAIPGTLVAAVGWTLLEALFQVYLSVAASGSSGLLGGVVVLLTWLYFGSLVILVGAVVNAVLSTPTDATAFGETPGTASSQGTA